MNLDNLKTLGRNYHDQPKLWKIIMLNYIMYVWIEQLGAVGAISAPIAAAELEGGDESGLVTVDTPTMPSRDIETLLHKVWNDFLHLTLSAALTNI